MGAVEGGPGPDLSRVVDLPEFIGALVQLRAQAGSPSYRTLAKKTGLLLRPPREIPFRTVSDMFDNRRRRLDLDLTVAIVRALGVDEQEVDAWRQTCIRVHASAKSGGPVGVFRQLPADSAGFIGRESELARFREAVEMQGGAGKTVTVAVIGGMAGVGKTQLAVHAAHAFIRSGRYRVWGSEIRIWG